MITLNLTNKPSTKAIFIHPIQIKLQEGPCIKSYLHIQPYIFKIRPLFKQSKHMMHKIIAVLLCRHLGCHNSSALATTTKHQPTVLYIQTNGDHLNRTESKWRAPTDGQANGEHLNKTLNKHVKQIQKILCQVQFFYMPNRFI